MTVVTMVGWAPGLMVTMVWRVLVTMGWSGMKERGSSAEPGTHWEYQGLGTEGNPC